MKFIISVMIGFLLVGCSRSECFQQSNVKLRRELFQQCLKSLPLGPTSVVNNDWSEVVDSCDSIAFSQSFEKPAGCE